jgi:hypothetical protein
MPRARTHRAGQKPSRPVSYATAIRVISFPALMAWTNGGAASAGKLSRPPRAALRQANRCWGEMSCRRATSGTMAPGTKDSATIRPLASSLHRRRRPGTDLDIDPTPRLRTVDYMVNHVCEPNRVRWVACCSSTRGRQGGERRPLTIQCDV